MPKLPFKPVKSVGEIKAAAMDAADKIKSTAGEKLSEEADKLIPSKLRETADSLGEKAAVVRDSAMAAKDDIESKLTELDRMLEQAVTDYNDAYTLMNDKGIRLYLERCRATDSIINVESLINSISNHPKSFDADFEEITTERKLFTDSCAFADRELQAARQAAGGAGAGLAAGASVAFMAPTAAMWIATTFGTASTGAAISTLSGAAASNAALAWLGGGAVAASGGGMAAGQALLAMAGPIGWTIAGATLLSSILLFASKRTKLNAQKNDEIEKVKNNTETVKEMDEKIAQILTETESLRNALNTAYTECLQFFGADYRSLSDECKMRLGALVNSTKALSTLFGKTVEQPQNNPTTAGMTHE